MGHTELLFCQKKESYEKTLFAFTEQSDIPAGSNTPYFSDFYAGKNPTWQRAEHLQARINMVMWGEEEIVPRKGGSNRQGDAGARRGW